MDIPCITTERLLLRAFSEQDVDPLFDILQQPGILRYYPRPDPPPRETAARIVARQLAHWGEFGYGWWAVGACDDPRLLGWAGLTYLPETGETEVAYLLRQEVWRRGLATEAAKAALRFGFDRFAFPFIVGLTHPENIASQRVLEKSGLHFVEKAVYFGMDCFRFVIEAGDGVG